MNGRVYDPDLGRFVSADPHIQFEKNTQSYNRYSYVSNNPLKYTDPSGYFLDKVFKELRRFGDKLKAELRRMSPGLATAISIGLSFVSPWLAGGFSAALADANGASFGEIAVSFGIGYAGSQFNGSLNGAFRSAIPNAFLRGAVSGALTGAFTGGVQATINGTSLRKGVQDGMAAGALTSGIVGAIRGNPAKKTTTGGKESQQGGQTVGGGSGGGAGGPNSSISSGQSSAAVSKPGAIPEVITTAKLPDIPGWARNPAGFALFAMTFSSPAGENSTSSSVLTTDNASNQRTFLHYGYAADAFKFENGLLPGSFATDFGTIMPGEVAQQLLALPNPIPPDSVYFVTVSDTVPVVGPSIVKPIPALGRSGGGVEYIFPEGTPPGSVMGPFGIQ